MVHDDQDAGLADASRSACGAKDDVAVPAAEAAEAAEATEEDVSSSDDDGPLGAEGKPQAGQPQGPVRVRRPKCQRCGRQAIQVAEAVARERRKAKERAGKALQRAKLKRQERVAAERTKWRKILAEKLEAVRAKAAADKARKTALFWAKKAANKAARLAVGIPTDGTWVWGGEGGSVPKTMDEDAASHCPMALDGSEVAEPSLPALRDSGSAMSPGDLEAVDSPASAAASPTPGGEDACCPSAPALSHLAPALLGWGSEGAAVVAHA
jgi:hypothetical protein